MSDTLTSLFDRLSTTAYDLPAVIVELLLIGLCVNWCARLLEGTRGTRPLRGLLMILIIVTMVVRVLAVQFGWVRLDLLYSYVLFGLAFIALVAFQPELRRAVIRMGDVRFRRGGRPKSQLIASLVKSAGYLSRNRYGALMAIQRDVDLTGWAENGTLIKAEVSANLLNTIFFPNSPLHDLGAIIQGRRVMAANCQFPSPDSDEIDVALGSRHLAAVGMSYETDALVLVVSEETGVVSLADNGKLTRYLSLDDLSVELTTRLGGSVAPERSGRQKRLGSTVWRRVRRLLVVVPLTLVIWYLADQATLAEARVRLELNVRHDDPSYIVDLEEPRSPVFATTFSGPARAIDQLRADAAENPLKVNWVLPEPYARPGAYVLSATQIKEHVEGLREIGLRGLSVVDVALERLRFGVDELVPLSVPVKPDGGAIRIMVESVDPLEVTATLRRSQLDRLPPEGQRFVRAPLEDRLAGLEPDEVRRFEQVPVEDTIGPVRVERVNPRGVTVAVRVIGQRKRIENVVVHLWVSPEVARQYEVEQSDLNEWRIDVEVEGIEAVVESLRPSDILAFVTITSDLLPPAGQPLEEQFRSVEVITVLYPPRKGASVVYESRLVRVNLVPRPGSQP